MTEPATYQVVWRTEEFAADPLAAALAARRHQHPGTSAVVFEVTGPDGATTEVDLGTQADSTEPEELAAALIAKTAREEGLPLFDLRGDLRAAAARIDEPYDPDEIEEENPDGVDNPLAHYWATLAMDLADKAGRLLAWMEDADVDPGDPPLCGCGGYHWTCSADDAGAEDWEEVTAEIVDEEPCAHEHGSTTYLRPGAGPDGTDLFEDTCGTCGAVLTANTLAQIEQAVPGSDVIHDLPRTSGPTAVTVDGTVIAVTRHIDLTEEH